MADLDEYVPRKRKSNFDVPPEAVGLPSLDIEDIRSKIRELSELSSPQQSWVSVTEASYTARLEKSLARTFDYISRKDSNPPGWKSSNSQSSSSGSSITMKLQQRVNLASSVKTGGLGLVVQAAATQTAESTSVYVCGLPADISEEELDILFSGQGKIKKIKIYADKQGKKKGDALVTYAKAEAVTLACHQLNRLDIGEGCIISVSKAAFQPKDAIATADDTLASSMAGGGFLHTVVSEAKTTNPMSVEEVRVSLPSECEASSYPVVVLHNACSGLNLDSDMDLETDLMLECCRFGKLVRLVSPDSEPLGGCVVVTFHETEAARDCATALNGRWFASRMLSTTLLLPRQKDRAESKQPEEEEGGDKGRLEVVESKGDEGNAQEIAASDCDIDDFLMSLL